MADELFTPEELSDDTDLGPEDDLGPEGDLGDEDDLGDEESTEEGEAESEGTDDPQAIINEVSAELEAMGVVVTPSKDADEFLRHLATALKTHKATKDLESGEADRKPAEPETPVNAEQPPALMSSRALRNHKDPVVRMLAAREEKRARESRLAAIDKLVRQGRITKAMANELRAEASGLTVTLSASGEPVPSELDKWLVRLSTGTMPSRRYLLSVVSEQHPPADSTEAVKATIEEMAKMAK